MPKGQRQTKRQNQAHAYEYIDYVATWDRLARDASGLAVETPWSPLFAALVLRKLDLCRFTQLRDTLLGYYDDGATETRLELLESILLFNDPPCTDLRVR